MNEHREANNEEDVGESDNDGDDALDLEEGFKNSLLGRQSEVNGTTIVDEESGRLPPSNPIDWTRMPVKTQIGEPEFETADNPSQWSEFNFCPVYAKGGVIYKIHDLPIGVMPVPQYISVTRRINAWDFHYNDWDDGVGTEINTIDYDKKIPPEHKVSINKIRAAEVGSHQTQDGCARFYLLIPDFPSDM